MSFETDYLTLVGNISNFTEEVTGAKIIDAYFGPKDLLPSKERKHEPPEKLLMTMEALIEKAKEIDDELRRIVITSDLESLKVVVRWVSGEDIPYVHLVKELFEITPTKFHHSEIQKAKDSVETASASLPGSSVSERILKWREENKISGEALRKMIENDIVERTKEIEALFRKRVFSYLHTSFENGGVIYEAAQGVPWSGYNYYQGNYKSINAFNVDRPVNKYGLVHALHHEYEHHVAGLFREKCYCEKKLLDLCVILLLTKQSIISEGTADCTKEFLGSQPDKHGELLESLNRLHALVSLNAAYMLNVENTDYETVTEYIADETHMPIEDARRSFVFLKPFTSNGKINLFKPYVYTYFFGKRDYVLPTFQKSCKKDKLEEFFQTLYLNPYSRSTATWKTVFGKI